MRCKRVFVTYAFLSFGSLLLGQALPPGPCGGENPCIPIDQGAVVLFIGALILGVYHLVKKRVKDDFKSLEN